MVKALSNKKTHLIVNNLLGKFQTTIRNTRDGTLPSKNCAESLNILES